MIHIEFKRLLVAPLDWGAGHATRCIPVIKELLAQNAIPVLAGSKSVLARLNVDFPELEQVHLPDVEIQYSKNLPAWLAVLFQASQIKRVISKENELLKGIVLQHKIDAVISDNRYGLSGSGVPSVIITHQLNLPIPWALRIFGFIAQNYVNKMLSKFDEIWVPDVAQIPNLSGKLSQIKSQKNAHFIGVLSRFENEQTPTQFKYDVAIILSGPAPQPEILLQIILQNLPANVKQVVVLSVKEYSVSKVSKDVTIHWKINASDDEFSCSLAVSACIIARSGYSTLMDLLQLNRNALLIPTPGQTEQNYLARHFEEHFGFVKMNQKEISRKSIEVKLKKLKNETVFRNIEIGLKKPVKRFLEKQ
jgi:UDP-N-acetylglucosamine:LPS N-acetylglucosamine transferase